MTAKHYDVIVRSGTIYDGSGGEPAVGDVAIAGDRIASVGARIPASASLEIDASGLAVAPGFINMLSWANVSLLHDGRSQGDIRQGVTLEVLGEGSSMGPLNDAMKRDMVERQTDVRYDVCWTTLAEYLQTLQRKGVSCNVASFMGATSARIHELGHEDRLPTTAELARMQALVRTAMAEGAMGLSSALIYAPASYSDTHELIELAKPVGECDGLYISHIRGEGATLFEALDEFLTIAREAKVRAEIYHMKQAGESNWDKQAGQIASIEAARADGLAITADMYNYVAAGTGLGTITGMPLWAYEGGHRDMIARLTDPATRARIRSEMHIRNSDHILLVAFKNEELKPLAGKTLTEVAAMRGKATEDTAIDLIVDDDSRVGAVHFAMSEENVRRQIALPWVSFGSDGASMAAEGVFLKSGCHPRAYGNFARLLGRYVRDERIIPLQEAVRKLSALPADNLRLQDRGRLVEGMFADVVAFDPATIADKATFAQPHQYAVGVKHVLVNGTPVLRDGEHTGATPGRVVNGPGWRKNS